MIEDGPITEPESPTEEGPDFSASTMTLLGPSLPIGVPSGVPPILEKSFTFREFFVAQEKAIDKMRNKKGGSGSHPGRVVQDVMAYMLTEWGGDPLFSQKSEKVRQAAIRDAFMADVLYAYVWLRIEAMGPVVAFNVECPHCAHEWKWSTDLSGLEVDYVERFDQLQNKTFELARGVKFGDKVYDLLEIGPPTWAAVSDVSQGARRGGTGDIKARMIQSCILGVLSSEDPSAPRISAGSALLDKMRKRDQEELTAFIDDQFPNVDLSMEIDCPTCAGSFKNSVQWNWDFFFSSSSLPKRQRR